MWLFRVFVENKNNPDKDPPFDPNIIHIFYFVDPNILMGDVCFFVCFTWIVAVTNEKEGVCKEAAMI
jgi:hypothetical protein